MYTVGSMELFLESNFISIPMWALTNVVHFLSYEVVISIR